MSPADRMTRPNPLSTALVAGLIILPPAAFAVAPGQADPAAAGTQAPPGPPPAILRGRVTNEAGAPLADVRIRVAIPATDMRHIDTIKDRRKLEARTDVRGDYRMEVPALAGRTRISLDATKPGYRRLVGTLMAGGDRKVVEVGPGAEAEGSMILHPALYFAGKVVDDHGRPIPSVEIRGSIVFGRGSAGIETTASRADGSFELFCYPEKPPALAAGPIRGVVSFALPDRVDTSIDDLYKLAPEERATLRVVLPMGYRVAGTVLDLAGKPVPDAMVKVTRKDGTHRKATMTDANGKFALRGLSPGLNLVDARALPIKQKTQLPMALSGDRTDLEVRLRPITLPTNLEKHTVLGMQLTDVTPELKSAYDLFHDRGALILDPGQDPDRLKIGEIAEGCVFWTVGRQRIGSVREFVERILAETAGQNADQYRVRVVYEFTRVDFDGSRTAYLQLTKDEALCPRPDRTANRTTSAGS